MDQEVDIIIIGAGPGGYSTALRAAQLGKSVVLIERDATLGGTCLNRGCIPSKALLTATRVLQTIDTSKHVGITAEVSSIDFAAMRDYKLGVIKTMTSGLAGLIAHRGVLVYRGQAQLEQQQTVVIRPSNEGDSNSEADGAGQVLRFAKANVPEAVGTEVRLTARDIVLAMGSRSRPLPYHPFTEAVIDSTQALSLDQFPSSAVIIGAGSVAVEFASMWNQAGTDVTLLIRKDRVLSSWNSRIGSALTKELKRQGIKVIAHSQVYQVDTGVNLGATVHFRQESQDLGHDSADDPAQEDSVYGEVILAAIGRDPQTDADWLGSNSVALDQQGQVQTDPWGRTGNPHIWALGDITDGLDLAHRAYEQGLIIAESIAGLKPRPLDSSSVPQVVFSTPEAACVGLTLEQARQRPDLSQIKESIYPMMGNARMLMNSAAGSMSLVSGAYADKADTPVVLGVHMLAPSAGDLIAEAEELVGNRVPLSDAARLVHPHLTFSETLGEALLKADGRPLHTL